MQKKSSAFTFAITAFCLVGLASCSLPNEGSASAQQKAISQAVFSDDVTEFGVDVFYEDGSAPYVGTVNFGLATSYPTWSIFEESFKALFSTHTARTVSAPADSETLNNMENIGTIGRASWSYSQLKNLGDNLNLNWNSGTTIRLGVIFISGTYSGKDNILGLHLTGTPYTFIFKDIVESVGSSENQRKLIEQAVVVHEVGHIVGLVNSSVPMHTPHEDLDHAHHSQNTNCVMYWAVNSTTGIEDFVGGILGNDNRQLFGPESRADAENYHP